MGAPKNHERRDVDLTPDVVELLGSWWGECGFPTSGDVLVFPGDGATGYLSSSNLVRAHMTRQRPPSITSALSQWSAQGTSTGPRSLRVRRFFGPSLVRDAA